MEWTPQQQTAIETRGRSLIVSAAAGSGKTAVLVERLLRILSVPDGVRADSMVVVTFTNDAAAQMKQRLTKALTEKLASLEDGGDARTYEWLLEQRAALSSAKICTIHSFCFDLIRENAETCGVSPLFTIAEPAQERIYQQHALQTVMEQWSRRPEMETLFSRFCAREDAELEEVVLAIADYLDSLPFRSDWIRRAIALSREDDALLAQYRTACCEALDSLICLIGKGRAAAEAVVSAPDNRYTAKLAQDIAALTGQKDYLMRADKEELFSDPLKSMAKLASFPRASAKEQADPELRSVFQQFCELYRDLYKKPMEEMLRPLRYFREDTEAQRVLIPLLLELTEDYLDALFREKCDRNVLSFSDAEEVALGLLGKVDAQGVLHRSALAEDLSEQISLIMVDEYQDSNNKQDCLFKLLSKGCRLGQDGLHYGSNIFLVGDVKQSIYSFRQANPENFRRAIAESTPLAACTGQETALIYLNQNFRSAPGVLEFVNRLCGAVMTEACGEVCYNTDEQLNFGSPVYQQAGDIRTVLLLPQPEALPEEADMQAECIADTIAQMLRSHAPVLEPGGKQRPCAPGDFCILLRSVKKHGGAVTAALEKRGIPVNTDQESGLLAQPEICLIRNILRVVDNPMTDTAAAAVLVSRIYGFSAEELAELKLYGKRRRLYLQMRAVAAADDLPAEAGGLQLRCKDFLAALDAMRQAAEQLPLEECIRRIYDMTDLLSLQSLERDSALRREHLEAFVKQAQTYRETTDLTSQGSLSGWLRYLDRLTEAGKDIDITAAAAENSCVAVKTIHKSKGLEFPFVFAAHLDAKFNTSNDASEPVQADESGLMGLYLYDHEQYQRGQSITFRYLLERVRRRQKSEELRLLYVALTRARQQLFVVMDDIREGASKSVTTALRLGPMLEASPETAALLAPRAASMQDWVLYFLLASGEAAHLYRAREQGEGSTSRLAEYRVWKGDTAAPAEEPALQEVSAAPDQAFLAEMQAQIGFTYQSPQTELVSKYSVTQLAHPEAAAELARTPRLAIGEDSGKALTGAARGTAVHKTMQYMELADAAADPAAEIARLREAGYLSEAEAAAVSPELLRTFFDSPLYRRIAASPEVLRERQLFVRIGELALPQDAELAQRYSGTDGVLIGTMDLLFREGDSWVLVDYKTDYAASAETLLKAYSLQLGLYQKAAELLLGMPVKEAYLYSFSLGTEIAVPLADIQY